MKFLLTAVLLFLLNIAHSQTLVFDNERAYKYPSSDDEADTIHVFINDDNSSKNFKVTVSIVSKNTAILMRDYDLNLAGLNGGVDSHNPGSFILTIKKSQRQENAILRLDIKATSDDTVLHTQLQIVLSQEPKKIKRIDETNTPKCEFITYTDFKGFDPDQPNGAAQSQFLWKLPINHHYSLAKDGETQFQMFRSILPFSFLFNRIDKSGKPISLTPVYSKNGNSVRVSSIISSFDFIKYSSFIWNPKLTIFTVIRPESRFQAQIVGNLYRLNIDSATFPQNLPASDSVARPSDTTISLNRAWAYAPGLELYYDTHYSPDQFPFNFRVIAGVQFIKLMSSEYSQADVASLAPDNSRKIAALIDGNTRKISAPVWNLSLMIKKNLGLKKESGDEDHYLFFRFNYNWQSFKGKELTSQNPVAYESKNFTNNFAQFQLGVDLTFDGFFR